MRSARRSWSPAPAADTVLPEFDPYLDPETGILRNLVGARTAQDLALAESELSWARWAELADAPVAPTGDINELRAIHRHLFQDIYDWAGEPRTIDMRKGDGPLFAPKAMLAMYATNAETELADDTMLRNLSREQFIQKLAHHYDQWNDLHLFREGNGRAGRVFWERIANDAGWTMDWTRIGGPENAAAFQTAREHQDLKPLASLLNRIVEPYAANPTYDAAAAAARAGFTDMHRVDYQIDFHVPVVPHTPSAEQSRPGLEL